MLYATRGLFAATDVDAGVWDRFIHTQNAPDRYPGMKAIAYAEIVSPTGLPKHLERLRQENQSQAVVIHPERKADEHVILTYHEETALDKPTQLDALGFDLTTSPERYIAIKQAHATNKIAATSPINLVTDGSKGFLLLLPLSANPETAQDPTAIFGYSIAAFDASALINSTIGDRLEQYRTSISITDVTDGQSIPLYARSFSNSGQTITRNVTIDVANRNWRITFKSPSSSLLMVTDRWAPTVVLVVGIGSIFISCLVIYALRLRNALRCSITS
jgi:CHASE1-domain containing sensor protein